MKESKVEVTDGEKTWYDAETAHKNAGDELVKGKWSKFLPDSCVRCEAKALSHSEAQKSSQGDPS